MSDDPRDSNLEVKVSKPPAWNEETVDFISTFSMLMAGATMITRNRQLAWPSVAIALSGWINQHPLRTKEGGQGVGPVLFALGAVATTYMPMMVLNTISSPVTQTPLST